MNSSTNYFSLSLLVLIFLFITGYPQGGWNDLTPLPNLPGLSGVYALDSDNVWVVGADGTILHTTNGGLTWVTVPIMTTEDLTTVEFINPDTGWVVVGSSTDSSVFRTTDGGLTWELQPLWTVAPNEYLVKDIEFIEGNPGEPMRAYLVGGLTQTWISDNYGETWISIRGACGSGNFWSCCFVDKNTGWFVGEASNVDPSTILHTTDGCTTWIQQTNPTVPERPLRSVSFATDQRGLAVGLVGTILYTNDGGTNWEARPNNGYRWESVFLTQTGRAWAVGDNGKIAYSSDWGYTWETQQSGASCELWEVYFINENEGWIVGGGIGYPGVILHTTNGGVTDINDQNNLTISEYRLYQNYPNPFNPSTTIEFDLPKSSVVTLKVFNILGEEVTILVSDKLSTGSYSYEWDASNLASGVYLYRLQAGDYVETRKMVLMR